MYIAIHKYLTWIVTCTRTYKINNHTNPYRDQSDKFMYIAKHKYILDIYMYTHQQNLIHTKLIRDFFVSNDFKKKEAEPPAFGPYLSVLLFGGGRVKELLHVSHEEQHAIRKEGEEGHEKGAVFLFLVEDLLRWRQAIP